MNKIHVKDLSNQEIVTLAVFLPGGDAQKIDTEDVAKKANDLAAKAAQQRPHSRTLARDRKPSVGDEVTRLIYPPGGN